jgi:hypothetical protein
MSLLVWQVADSLCVRLPALSSAIAGQRTAKGQGEIKTQSPASALFFRASFICSKPCLVRSSILPAKGTSTPLKSSPWTKSFVGQPVPKLNALGTYTSGGQRINDNEADQNCPQGHHQLLLHAFILVPGGSW